jgi:hypothetical protein
MTKADRALIVMHMEDRRAERVRIDKQGRVHGFGPMPNSSKVGWWYAGFVADLLPDLRNRATWVREDA